MFNLRGRYPLTLAMLETEQVKRVEVIGVHLPRTGEMFCLECWEKILIDAYSGAIDSWETEEVREYITAQNVFSYTGEDLFCNGCGDVLNPDTFGIRADLWQCESCGCDVYAYIIGPETGGKKVCRTCYKHIKGE